MKQVTMQQCRQFDLLVKLYGASPDEPVDALQCSDCGNWNDLQRWLRGFHVEHGVYRTEGLTCPRCRHFHDPFRETVQFSAAEH